VLNTYGSGIAPPASRMNIFRAFALLAVVLLPVACSESPTSPSPTTDQLAGTWTVISIQLAGQGEQPAPAGAVYTLTFDEGRLSTRADCNTCGGTFVVSGPVLTAGPGLACTRAACPTMAFENSYTGLLAGESTVTLSDDRLVLSSLRGTLRLLRARPSS
jgi:heat shock protein HslJ